jgi:conjugal transfer pilus assembly protein TraL
MADSTEIPKYIDDPPLILLWRVDDLIPIVLCLVIRIFTGCPSTMFIQTDRPWHPHGAPVFQVP